MDYQIATGHRPETVERGRTVAPEREEEEAARPEKGEEPEPFFPNFIFKEALVALVAFIILSLVVVYAKIPMERLADPTDTSYVPRPEWYFLFLFQMLKYFPGKWEPMATVAIPGGFIALLVALPFIDKKPRLSRAPRPLATAAAIGLTTFIVLLTFLAIRSTPARVESGVENGRQLTPAQAIGQQLYKSTKCDACHSISGQGGTTAPDLGQVGTRHDAAWLHTFLENPQATNPNAAMKSYLGQLSHQDIENLAQYLAAQK